MAFAHGSNDVANAIGPLSAVVSIVEHGGQILPKTQLAWWILPLGAIGIVMGLVVLGYKVMATIEQASRISRRVVVLRRNLRQPSPLLWRQVLVCQFQPRKHW